MVLSHPHLQLQSTRSKALTAIAMLFARFFRKVSVIATCDFLHYLFSIITLSEWSASQLVQNEKIFATGSTTVGYPSLYKHNDD